MVGTEALQLELPEREDTPKPKRRVLLVVAVLVAVLAMGAFAYALVWSGGIDQVTAFLAPYLGLSSDPQTPPRTTTPAPASTGQPPVKSTDGDAVVLPAWAQETMYQEQLASQSGMTSVVDSEVKSFAFGTPAETKNGVEVPLTATYSDGTKHSGTINLILVDGMWYFAGLDTGESEQAPVDGQADDSVVAVITKSQASASSQDGLAALAEGTITGMDVVSVTEGTNAVSVNVVLHGGDYEGERGRFILVEKTRGLDYYWFLTGFAWQ